ncbi:MAG: hypothetical protein ACJ0BJ_00255 [Pirellulales bacterium]
MFLVLVVTLDERPKVYATGRVPWKEKAVFKTLQQGYGNEKASQLGKLRGLKSGYRSVGLWGGTAAEKNQLYWWGANLPDTLNIH